MNLWAEAVNTVTNESLKGLQLQFLDNGQKITTPPTPLTNSSGETSIQWNYKTDGEAHALNVAIDPDAVAKNRTMATQPITLTVGKETRLSLVVTREESSTNHTISGTLLYNQAGVDEKIVKIKVNEAEYTETTEVDGGFSLSLDLQPLNNEATTYQISATFEGDNAKTVTAYAKAPNGEDIPICQTIQYGYKPASNYTSLTVEPPQPESSLWYPWFSNKLYGRSNVALNYFV